MVFDSLELMRHARRVRGRRLEYLVLDFASAFYHFPVAHIERRYLTTKVRDFSHV